MTLVRSAGSTSTSKPLQPGSFLAFAAFSSTIAMKRSTFSGLIRISTCSTKVIVSPGHLTKGAGRFCYNPPHAPVAQMDRVLGYEPRGRAFESLRARQFQTRPQQMLGPCHLYRRVAIGCAFGIAKRPRGGKYGGVQNHHPGAPDETF